MKEGIALKVMLMIILAGVGAFAAALVLPELGGAVAIIIVGAFILHELALANVNNSKQNEIKKDEKNDKIEDKAKDNTKQ